MTIENRPVLEQLAEAVKWWNADEAEEPDVRRLFAACQTEIERLGREVAGAQIAIANWRLQTGCGTCFDASRVINDLQGAVVEQTVRADRLERDLAVLRELLGRFAEFERDNSGYCEWCGTYAEHGHKQDCIYPEVRAALRCAEGGQRRGYGKPDCPRNRAASCLCTGDYCADEHSQYSLQEKI